MQMNKPLLTFTVLSVLAVAHPGSGVAAPAAGSTEESDRKFLAQLEGADSAPSDVNQKAPAPAPIAAGPRPNDKPPQTRASTPSKKTAVVAKASHSARRLPPAEVADEEVTPPAVANPATVTVEQTKDHDRDRVEDHNFFHRLFGRLLSKHPEDW
jgi:hypothetical protein